MSTVYADTDDSLTFNSAPDTWANVRGDVSSSSSTHSNSFSGSTIGINTRAFSGRGTTYRRNSRSYFPFDLSGVSGTATAVSLNVYADNLGYYTDEDASIFVVQSTALAGGTSDYGNCFSSGTTLGTLFGIGVSSTTEGYCTITFNSGGISAVNSAIGSGTLTLGCLSYYDFTNTAPTTGSNYAKIKLTYANYTGTSRDPYLDITYGGAAAATDNATFFGCNF